MKKIIAFLLLLALSATSFSQQTSMTKMSLSKTDYLQKSKNQKKAARILLIGGAGLLITSLIIPKGELVRDGICIGIYCSDEYKNDDIRAAVAFGGALSMLGSIPMFIISNRNKRKAGATTVFFDMEKAPLVQQGVFINQPFPALGIKLCF